MSTTEMLFREDAYLRSCDARVLADDGEGIELDRTVFYPTGGGQPGDSGELRWGAESARIVDTRYGPEGAILHLLEPQASRPPVGAAVRLEIAWDRRYRHMRMHTALHLLGTVLPYGVTGGNISAERSRLDFDMEDTIDKAEVEGRLAALVTADHPIRSRWITDAELDAQPELVRTLSVQPPRGAGRVRLLEIVGIDLQPCGGTHLRSTGEVGAVRLGKVEKKGRHNRRVNIHLED